MYKTISCHDPNVLLTEMINKLYTVGEANWKQDPFVKTDTVSIPQVVKDLCFIY